MTGAPHSSPDQQGHPTAGDPLVERLRRWVSARPRSRSVAPSVREVRALLDRLDTAERDSIDEAHLRRQRAWSEATFGPGARTKGVVDHIRKELLEIEAAPDDLGEWVDVVILALDGAWRSGANPEQIIAAIRGKQARNEARTWPDWRTMSPDQAIEHVRTEEPEQGADEPQPVVDLVGALRASVEAARARRQQEQRDGRG